MVFKLATLGVGWRKRIRQTMHYGESNPGLQHELLVFSESLNYMQWPIQPFVNPTDIVPRAICFSHVAKCI